MVKNLVVGVLVLYNPESEKVISNISNYLDELDELLLVDNSSTEFSDVHKYYSDNNKVKYIPLKKNMGISHALNLGIEFASEKKANWLLTMDQDSTFNTGDLSRLVNIATEDIKNKPQGFIYSPRHDVPYIADESNISQVLTVMTSGNILNMSLIEEVGFFEEKLFIDSVDHEYCFRANKMGFGVYRVNEIMLEHGLGDITMRKLFGKDIHITNHNYIRRYYITRNILYVRKLYSKSFLRFMKFAIFYMLESIVKVGFFENDKKKKFKSMLLGLKDFIRNSYGPKEFYSE